MIYHLQNKDGRVTKEAGFLALDDDTPVYIVGSEMGGPTIFDDYKNRAPPASNFTIPETCTKSTHSPLHTNKIVTNNLFSKVQKKFVIP